MSSTNGVLNASQRIARFFLDIFRGFLMGIAEVLPGISGGTVALIIGIYERIVFSAAEAVKGFLLLFTFSKSKWVEAGMRFRTIEWSLLIPLLIGMIAAILASSAAVYPLLIAYPTLSSAAFAGLILASLAIPIKMAGGRFGLKEILVAALAAAFAFGFASIPKSLESEPTAIFIFISAALAVCALALPGISGSNLLIAMGMYTPVLAAVNNLNFGYLGIFLFGAVVGFGSFVGILEWLFENKRRMTLIVMTGLMVGSVRALWPWQSDTGGLEAPSGSFVPELVVFALSVLFVLTLMAVERRFAKP